MINQMLQNVTSKYKGLSLSSPHSFATLFLYSSAITKGPLFFIRLLNYAYFMLHQTLNELKVYNIKSLDLQG